jgi:hypothetical protein
VLLQVLLGFEESFAFAHVWLALTVNTQHVLRGNEKS